MPLADHPIDGARTVSLAPLGLLCRRLREELGIVYGVSAYRVPFSDAGAFVVTAFAAPQDAAVVVRESAAVFADLARVGPTKADLRRVRSALLYDLGRACDGICGLADYYGEENAVGAGSSIDELRRSVSSITVDSVRAAASRIFDPSKMAVCVRGHGASAHRRSIARAVSAVSAMA